MDLNMMMLMAMAPISPALQKALTIIAPALMIIMVLLSIAIIVIILAQSGNTSDVTAISGGKADTYVGKNKTGDRTSRLKKLTYIFGAAMLVNSIAYFVVQLIGRQV